MKCPHCSVNIKIDSIVWCLGTDSSEGYWLVSFSLCPSCEKAFIHLHILPKLRISQIGDKQGVKIDIDALINFEEIKSFLVEPKGSLRPPCPPEVPEDISEDYKEACLVLPDSPKASAALSMRCLQNILRDAGKVKHGNLSEEIEQVMPTLHPYLAEQIDAIRNIGNFATHPMKEQNTGEIVPVEPGEAEWNLDVIEALFDFYYVQPANIKKKKDALNTKLSSAGKPPMK